MYILAFKSIEGVEEGLERLRKVEEGLEMFRKVEA
jgi:hypothetical protein